MIKRSDVAGVQASVELFFSTSGRAGMMTVPVLWNARAYSLLGTGLALLISAYRVEAVAHGGPRRGLCAAHGPGVR